jgi:hypothetical protein
MTAAPALATVAFVCGAGHSGSTLFGLMLGSHPRALYAGEAKKSLFLGDETKARKKRVCKVCGEGCVLWSRVPPADPHVHETLAALSGRAVVVDSSKDVAWIEARAETAIRAGAGVRLFFLQRDGRAVVGSRLRKYPDKRPADHARDWIAQIAAARALASRFPGGAKVVRYEVLCTESAEVVGEAARHVGLELVPEMLEPWRVDHHPLGGNSGTEWLLARERLDAGAAPTVLGLGEKTRDYYAAHPRAIVLDERWRRELSADVVRAIEDVLGDTNREMAWP